MPNTSTRIFALDPSHRGFGYAVLELPTRLVDWGLASIKGDKYAGAIASFGKLLDRFRPDAVVLEDTEAPGSRRQPRIRRLIDALLNIVRERGIAVYTIARSAVLKCFASDKGPATKQTIAERLAFMFPELADQVPAPRKPWHSENVRMSSFDALALAVTHGAA